MIYMTEFVCIEITRKFYCAGKFCVTAEVGLESRDSNGFDIHLLNLMQKVHDVVESMISVSTITKTRRVIHVVAVTECLVL